MRPAVFALLVGCSFGSPRAGVPDGEVVDAATVDTMTADAQTSFIIQAENATRTKATGGSAWIAEMTPSGFTGTGVMTLQPNAPSCTNPLVENCANMEFDITILEGRTYYAFVRMYASNGSEDSLF